MDIPHIFSFMTSNVEITELLTFAFLILFLVTLLVSAVGFYNVVYFVSVGYAFSIVATVFAALFLFREGISVLTLLQCGILAVYGIRLGVYLLRREFKQASYRKEMDAVEMETGSVPFFVKVAMWLAVAVLYVLMISPAVFNLSVVRSFGDDPSIYAQLIGIGIMLSGLILETVADQQKSAFKKHSPNRFCDVGVYRWVRFPNYFGEIVFWSGNWVAGFGAYIMVTQWVMGLLGLLGIIFVMLVSSMRLERKQDQRYGTLLDYQNYKQNVQILIPIVPIYTLRRRYDK